MVIYATLFVSFFVIAFLIRFKRDIFYTLAKNSLGLVNELMTDLDENERIDLIQK